MENPADYFVLLLSIENLYDIFDFDCMCAAQILFYFDEQVVFVSGDLLCKNFGCSLVFEGVYLFEMWNFNICDFPLLFYCLWGYCISTYLVKVCEALIVSLSKNVASEKICDRWRFWLFIVIVKSVSGVEKICS